MSGDIHLRWGDADAFGHINNATVMRLLEEARLPAKMRAALRSTLRRKPAAR